MPESEGSHDQGVQQQGPRVRVARVRPPVRRPAGLPIGNFRPELAGLGNAALFLDTVLLMVGLAYYAVAKGHHPGWCLMAFHSRIGFIDLGVLPGRAADAGSADAPRGSA
ncbi:MAG TPA: hypothetical protein VFY93_01985 [Planctomycetota bacterium]|nr:hypothetical protein [Planctomycetota bacterium]